MEDAADCTPRRGFVDRLAFAIEATNEAVTSDRSGKGQRKVLGKA